MLFHTWTFLLFFLVFFSIYVALSRTRFWLAWLCLASYVFYGWWNPYYLVLIAYSTWVDFFAVQRMAAVSRENPTASRRRKFWLVVSLINNLGVLAFFKYAEFLVSNLNALMLQLDLPVELIPPEEVMPFGWKYILPVGISFYTFQSMSYTIDFYRGRLERETSFLRFATYVALFPQLVAGPIERAATLLPQLRDSPRLDLQKLSSGASLFLVGLFKKLALANYLALYVDRVYGQSQAAAASEYCVATIAFAWQIYFDFSGYTDMARGIARAMGIELMLNFRHPYLATSLQDFWSRWHISLSTWFRDYVYVPLGGNRHSTLKTSRNLLIVFVVSGFWHGAEWTFLIWGAWHGLWIVVSRAVGSRMPLTNRFPDWGKRGLTFVIVCIGWVFFRAEDWTQVGLIGDALWNGVWSDPEIPALMVALVAMVWCYEWLQESRWRGIVMQAPAQIVLATGMLLYLLIGSSSGGEFIYFQF